MTEQNQNTGEEQINIFFILKLLQKNILLFIVFVLAALFVSYMVNRYAERIYSVSGQLLISEESKSSATPGKLLQDIPLLNQKPNVENETHFLKSTKFVKKPLKN